MKVLVFDTETSGLPKWGELIYNTEAWPYIVQLSYILYDIDEQRILICQDDIIKIPSKIVLSEECINIHGVTNKLCKRKGIDIKESINNFNNILMKSDIIVGHNIEFDKKMIMVESLRNGIEQKFILNENRINEYCTMKRNIKFCNIKAISKKGYEYTKYPKLSELHNILFGVIPKGLHDSLVDVLFCLRCYCMIEYKFDILVEGDKKIRKILNVYN